MFDVEVVETYLGKPTWFWFPEGGVDQNSLQILFELYPDMIVTIPDTSLSQINYNNLVNIRHPNGNLQKALIVNSLLKDVMMNAYYYDQKPPYVPKEVSWPEAQNMVQDGDDFRKILDQLGLDFYILARDWENKGSVDGLIEYAKGGKETKGLLELDAEFKLPGEVEWSSCPVLDLSEIKTGSWECDVPKNEPLQFWKINKSGNKWSGLSKDDKNWLLKWESMNHEYEEKFQKVLNKYGGVDQIYQNEEIANKVKRSFTALLSCFPWHFLAKKEYGADPSFPPKGWAKIISPAMKTLDELV